MSFHHWSVGEWTNLCSEGFSIIIDCDDDDGDDDYDCNDADNNDNVNDTGKKSAPYSVDSILQV